MLPIHKRMSQAKSPNMCVCVCVCVMIQRERVFGTFEMWREIAERERERERESDTVVAVWLL